MAETPTERELNYHGPVREYALRIGLGPEEFVFHGIL